MNMKQCTRCGNWMLPTFVCGCKNKVHEPCNEEAIAVRPDFITEANRAVADMRDILTQLNDEEKKYLLRTSPTYRQLVEMIRGRSTTRKVKNERIEDDAAWANGRMTFGEEQDFGA